MSDTIRTSDGESITLRDYIERILDEREAARVEAAKVLQVHLDNLNHWKEEALREREKLLSRELYVTEHEALTKKVELVEERMAKIVGIGIVLVVLAGLLGSFVGHILTK